jgi:ABC-type polysaccharide/polyol phosphate transport system ATPase subunit
MQPAIQLHGVGKRYVKMDEPGAMLRSLVPLGRGMGGELWALRDVELTLHEGETLGVLGHNGAGKTTLLRLLAGVTRPSHGRVIVRGRIGPLISLGVGFHPEMSGRENALVNAMLLGLTGRQASDRLESMVDFAELHEFIDTPVKFYSAGMTMRLGFSVIMHTDPTVLLIDEILAVGDAGFRFKCIERLTDLQAQGATVVVVSHSMHMLRLMCQRAIVIQRGHVEYDGGIEEAIAQHCAAMSRWEDSAEASTVVDVTERRLVGGDGESHQASYDAPMELQARLRFFRDVPGATVVLAIISSAGFPVANHTLTLGDAGRSFREGEETEVRIRFRARLGGGNYELALRVYGTEEELLGTSEGLVLFVTGRAGSLGVVDLRAAIEVDGQDRTDARASLLDASSGSDATTTPGQSDAHP